MRKAIHVIPLNDRIHVAFTDCFCHPLREDEGGNLRVIHNATDCREALERAGFKNPEKAWALIWGGGGGFEEVRLGAGQGCGEGQALPEGEREARRNDEALQSADKNT